MPYKRRQAIENLRRNNHIVLLKQDKGRGVVILNNYFLICETKITLFIY